MSDVDEDEVFDNCADIRKNLLAELEDSPALMPPPPMPIAEPNPEKMRVYLRIRPLKADEIQHGEDQVCNKGNGTDTIGLKLNIHRNLVSNVQSLMTPHGFQHLI